MTDVQVFIVVAVFVAVQASTFRKRWDLPLLRGEEWFLGVRVGPDFYRGAGAHIMRTYRIGVLWPYFAEAAAAATVLYFGKTPFLLYVLGGAAILISVNHALLAIALTKRARKLELADAGQPVSSVILSLKPRRLADYTYPKVEAACAMLNACALGVLAYVQSTASWPHTWRDIFGKGLFLLYLQAGALLVKRAAIGWRSAIPRERAQEHLEWRENQRRVWADMCDSVRVLFAALLVAHAWRESAGAAWQQQTITTVFVVITQVLAVIWLLWYRRRRNQYLELVSRTRPMRVASLEPETVNGPVCYRPDRPVMLIKGASGYALNLASASAKVGALYIAGLAGVYTWMQLGVLKP